MTAFTSFIHIHEETEIQSEINPESHAVHVKFSFNLKAQDFIRTLRKHLKYHIGNMLSLLKF